MTRPVRVLVVDDSEDTREMLAAVLELEGYRAVTAGRGRDALYLMVTLQLRPCVVVVDLMMPNMDGLTLQMAMLAHPDLAHIPAVALSGDERLRRQALDVGFAAALMKSSNLEHLFSIIAQTCPAMAATRRGKPA